MRSVLNNYAIEGAFDEDKDAPNFGEPTGVFYLNEANANALAREVLSTHKGLSGTELESYLDSYWSKAWGHFDVNKTGKIPYLYSAGLMRFLASDQYFQF